MAKGKNYRSAISGRYVKKSTAKAHPRTTVGETRRRAGGKRKAS